MNGTIVINNEWINRYYSDLFIYYNFIIIMAGQICQIRVFCNFPKRAVA